MYLLFMVLPWKILYVLNLMEPNGQGSHSESLAFPVCPLWAGLGDSHGRAPDWGKKMHWLTRRKWFWADPKRRWGRKTESPARRLHFSKQAENRLCIILWQQCAADGKKTNIWPHLSAGCWLRTAYCVYATHSTYNSAPLMQLRASLILVSVSVSDVLMRMCKMKMNNSAIIATSNSAWVSLATSVMNWIDTCSNQEWIWTIGLERSHFLWTPL